MVEGRPLPAHMTAAGECLDQLYIHIGARQSPHGPTGNGPEGSPYRAELIQMTGSCTPQLAALVKARNRHIIAGNKPSVLTYTKGVCMFRLNRGPPPCLGPLNDAAVGLHTASLAGFLHHVASTVKATQKGPKDATQEEKGRFLPALTVLIGGLQALCFLPSTDAKVEPDMTLVWRTADRLREEIATLRMSNELTKVVDSACKRVHDEMRHIARMRARTAAAAPQAPQAAVVGPQGPGPVETAAAAAAAVAAAAAAAPTFPPGLVVDATATKRKIGSPAPADASPLKRRRTEPAPSASEAENVAPSSGMEVANSGDSAPFTASAITAAVSATVVPVSAPLMAASAAGDSVPLAPSFAAADSAPVAASATTVAVSAAVAPASATTMDLAVAAVPVSAPVAVAPAAGDSLPVAPSLSGAASVVAMDVDASGDSAPVPAAIEAAAALPASAPAPIVAAASADDTNTAIAALQVTIHQLSAEVLKQRLELDAYRQKLGVFELVGEMLRGLAK